jgi:hypothetical protein
VVVEEDEDEQSEEAVVKAPQARFPPRRTFISGSPKSRSASARSNTKSSAHHLCSMPMPSRPFGVATASASTWRYVSSRARSPFSGEWQARISGTRLRRCHSFKLIAHSTAQAQTSKMGEDDFILEATKECE